MDLTNSSASQQWPKKNSYPWNFADALLQESILSFSLWSKIWLVFLMWAGVAGKLCFGCLS